MEPNETLKPNADIYFAEDPQIAYKEILARDEPIASGYFIRPFLNRIQIPSEDSNKQRKNIEALYKKRGISLFNDYPLLLCALPPSTDYPLTEVEPNIDYRVVILDGHHRVRYLPKELAREKLFSIVFSTSQGAQLYRKGHRHWMLNDSTNEEFFDTINNWADNAQLELSKVMPHFTPPPKVQFSTAPSGLIVPRSVIK